MDFKITKSVCFIIIAVMLCGLLGCTSQTEKNKKKNAVSFSGEYVKVLGGEVSLRATEEVTAEKYKEYGFNYIDDDAYFPMSEVKNADQKQSDKFAFPKMGDTSYYNDELPIYNFNVKEMGAKADGKTDDTSVIQSALSKAGTIGGGTVYLPAGTYCISGNLRVPEYVTLRGDFVPPDQENSKDNGTVLLAYSGKDDPSADSFITLSMSASVCNLTIYYPEQECNNITAYPPTVTANHKKAKYGADAQSVKNVWFVNSYYIFDMESAPYTALHWVKNIYGTPLKTGLAVKMCKDVGRIEGVYFSPQYWIKAQDKKISKKYSVQDNNIMFNYVFENSIGIKMYSSDWEYIYNYNAHMLKTALEFSKEKNHSANIQLSHSTFAYCYTGIDLTVMSFIGSVFSNTTIIASEVENSNAVLAPKYSKNPSLFNNCSFYGDGGSAVASLGDAMLQFVNCSFDQRNKSDKYAIDVKTGSVVLEQCEFKNSKKHIYASEKATALQVLGCNFNGEADIVNEKKPGYKSVFDSTPLDLDKQSGIPHKYIKNPPLPKSQNIFYIYTYGAKINTDCTEAFKAALSDAAKNGGTVYVPAGRYILSESITVPAGVELRGCTATTFAPKDIMGTVIEVAATTANSSEALVKLESGAGISGLSFYYPDQKITNGKCVEYPYAVQGLGDSVWVKNVCFINAVYGIDFSTYPSDNHYVQFVGGTVLKTGICLGSNSKNGWVENCHFNTHYWNDSGTNKFETNAKQKLIDFVRTNLKEFIYGYNYSEHVLGTFVYGANHGILFEEQNGKGFNGLIIGHGTDNAANALTVRNCDVVEFVNSELCVIDFTKDILYINIEKSNKGRVRIYNTIFMGQDKATNASVALEGGDIVFQQGHLLSGSDSVSCKITGGRVKVNSQILPASKISFYVSETTEKAVISGNLGLSPTQTEVKEDNVLAVINEIEDKLLLVQNRLK